MNSPAMDRYHFHLQDGVTLRDEQGQALPDIDSARSAAVDVLTETLRGRPEMLWRHGSFTVTVTDATDLTLFCVEVTCTDAPATRRS